MAYEIDININGSIEDLEATGTDKKKKDKQEDAGKGAKALANYIKGQAIQPIINNVKTQISQNIGLITGSQELQERVNFGLQVVETGQSLYNSAQGGIVLASAMKLSAGAGAVIGVAFGLFQIGIQAAFRQAQLNIRQNLEDRQIAHTRSRMGAGFNKSRTSGRE